MNTRCDEEIGTTIPATYTTPTNYGYGRGGTTFNVTGAYEVGPGMRRAGWTHMLELIPVRGKVARYAAVTVEAGEITRAQTPYTVSGSR